MTPKLDDGVGFACSRLRVLFHTGGARTSEDRDPEHPVAFHWGQAPPQIPAFESHAWISADVVASNMQASLSCEHARKQGARAGLTHPEVRDTESKLSAKSQRMLSFLSWCPRKSSHAPKAGLHGEGSAGAHFERTIGLEVPTFLAALLALVKRARLWSQVA